MEIVKNNKIEKAILVAVKTRDLTQERINEHLDELEMLASTAGAETVFRVVQDRSKIDSAHYIGKGKAEEIAELADLNDIDLLIFDDDLTATQVRNLEKIIEIKIVDRSGLILDIFASHAKTAQAKTQVELAQLQYMLPRLTRAWTHLSKQHGGIGTKGPGETQIETDRRMIRTRISKLKEKLKKIDLQQQTKSLSRKDFITTSLVGYTNAGKSTLINFLTDADVLAENKLFATLDSTTRSLDLAKNKNLMISDTVGFIRKLPHNLIESFKSTLNVVRDADIIIHVIDITNDFFEDHITTVEETLKELGCEDKPEIRIFNKVDALKNKDKIELVKNQYPEAILISAQRGINVSGLQQRLIEFYEENFGEHEVKLHVSESKLISQIHQLTDVLETKYVDEDVIIRYKTGKANLNKLGRLIDGKARTNN